jgi:hypothetical protein
MRPEERELCLRMVEAVHLRPRLYVVASLATERRSVCAPPRHSVFEFALMRIEMTRRAALIFKMEGQDLVRAASGTRFVALIARHGHMRTCQDEMSLAMVSDRKRGPVKILDGVATLTPVLIRGRSKLPVVSVLVTILAGGEFHFVNRILARGRMAFRALNGSVFPEQGILRRCVFFHAKK